MTYARFSRIAGLPPSTLHRLENGTQSLTLKKLEQMFKRLKCKVSDVFPG
jgi:DNA-binding Xre family transcriptional regulator